MADVSGQAGPRAGEEFTVPNAATNRYILGDAEVGFASMIAVEFDLNSAAATFDIQKRVTGSSTWVTSCLMYKATSATGVTSGTTTDVYTVDASGCEVAINVSANNGSPKITWRPIVG